LIPNIPIPEPSCLKTDDLRQPQTCERMRTPTIAMPRATS
jgi:hypothetical protein